MLFLTGNAIEPVFNSVLSFWKCHSSRFKVDKVQEFEISRGHTLDLLYTYTNFAKACLGVCPKQVFPVTQICGLQEIVDYLLLKLVFLKFLYHFLSSSTKGLRFAISFKNPWDMINWMLEWLRDIIKVSLHTAINRADFVSWWMWFNGSPTKV